MQTTSTGEETLNRNTMGATDGATSDHGTDAERGPHLASCESYSSRMASKQGLNAIYPCCKQKRLSLESLSYSMIYWRWYLHHTFLLLRPPLH